MSDFRTRLKKLAQTVHIIRNIGEVCPLYKQALAPADSYTVKPCEEGVEKCRHFKGQAIEFSQSSDFDKARQLKGVKCSFKG